MAIDKIKWMLLAFLCGLLSTSANDTLPTTDKRILNIAIIGAGASGLASAKNAIEQGHNVVIFEKGEALGGIWYYTDQIGEGIHSPMYSDLRTNTPYKNMEFPGHHFPEGTEMFPTHDVVWQYLDSYADEFGLKDHIKYHHLVVHVQSIDGDKWQIFVNDMQTNYTIMETFDAVFVCTGFCSSPLYPNIPGEFKGKILMHSHDYRTPDKFEGEKVLVIGGGTSGTDIVHQIRGIAKRVTHSYHIPSEKMSLAQKALDKARGIFSRGDNGITHKGDVKRFTKNGAEFSDGTKKNFTVVIFATGYKYSYPFLDENVGICAHDFYVEPLFKQILNIEHNTMAFIGLPITVAHNPMYDLQARFALKFISGEKQFPSQTKMRQDLQKQINANAEFHLKKPYMLGLDYKRYFRELAKTANIENVPNIRSG